MFYTVFVCICPYVRPNLILGYNSVSHTDHSFATRLSNVFVIGKGNKPYVSLPKGKGIRLTIAEEREKRIAQRQ